MRDTISFWIEDASGRQIASGSATLDAIEAAVDAHLSSNQDRVAFILRLEDAVGSAERSRITEAVEAAAKSACEWGEWLDETRDGSGWSGPRLKIHPNLQPAFGGREEEAEGLHAGVWANDRTFLFIELSWYSEIQPEVAETWVHLAHWHPDSMTSGSWHDSLELLPHGVLLWHRYRDEDGNYYEFYPAPTEPLSIARSINSFITASTVFGAEDSLLCLYALGFPADGMHEPFRIGLLPNVDSEAYELESFWLSPPPAAVEALRQLGMPSAGRRQQLLDAIMAYTTGGYVIGFEDLGPEWHAVIAELQDRANQ